MKIIRKRGDTSNILQVFIQDSSSTTGAGLTGLVNNTSGLTAYYHRDLDTTATVISLVTMTVGTFTSSGFKEIDATNMPGWYQFCPPDAALGSGTAAHSVAFHLKGATNMAPLPIECQLVAVDVEDTVRAGLTALPNAAAAAASGLPVLGTNATLISFTAGMVISNAGGDALQLTSSGSNGNGLNAAANGTGAGIKSTGGATGAGAKFVGGGTSGDGIDITTTSGDGLSILPTAGNGIVATANGTSKHGAVITGGTAGTSDGIKAVAGTGGVDIRGAITGNITGNLSGSAGSVTGAVGSVTGAVGSVTAAVTLSAKDSFTIRNNTAAAGAASTITLDAGASATNSFYNGEEIKIDSGTGAGQTRTISGYVGGTQVATVDRAWATNPDNTSVFTIFASSAAKLDSSLQVTAASVQGNVTGSVASVTAGVTVTTNNDKTGYSIASGGIGNGAHAAAELNNISDAFLDRNMATGTDSGTDSTAVRTVRQALRPARNKLAISAGVATVYKEDDTTASFTAAVSTTAGNPISTVDPT